MSKTTVCTPEVIEKFAGARRAGLPLGDCAIMAGIGVTTHKSWFERGAENEEPYVHFYLAVKQAEADFKNERIGLIKHSHDVHPNNWAASMTLLERLYPADFRRDYTRLNIDGIEGDNAIEKLSNLSNRIIDNIVSGDMSVEAGTLFLKAVDERRKLIDTLDHEKRLLEIESKLK